MNYNIPDKDVIKMNKLEKDLEKYANAYYNNNESLISDFEYDKLNEELQNLYKKYDMNKGAVGATPISKFSKVEHKHPMLSLENSYNLEDIVKWIENVCSNGSSTIVTEFKQGTMTATHIPSIEIEIEPKIDGLSISCIYKDGKLVQAITRGNGTIGEDVTENVMQIRNIPLQLTEPISIEVRGEVYMTRENFDKVNDQRSKEGEIPYANPRNLASGTLRQLDANVVRERGLHVLFYYIVGNGTPTQMEDIVMMKNLGLPTMDKYNFTVKSNDLSSMETVINTIKAKDYGFDIDGAVLKVNDKRYWEVLGNRANSPRWAIAYKYPTDSVVTTLTEVDWTIGRTGILTPVAHFNPITIGGTIVSYASLHNAEMVKKMDLKLNDRIIVKKAAEIIPQVVSVITEARTGNEKDVEYPDMCPYCDSRIIDVGPIIGCSDPEHCSGARIEQIKYFASRDIMNIKGLGDAAAATIVDYIMDEDDNLDVLYGSFIRDVGFRTLASNLGQKNAEKLIEEIDNSKNQPFERVLAGLQIPFIGRRMSKTLARHYGSIDKIKATVLDGSITKIEGVGTEMLTYMIKWFTNERNLKLIEDLRNAGLNMEMEIKKVNTNGKLAGLNFVVTGSIEGHTRESIKELIEENGGHVSDSVSSKTDWLIIGENPSKSKMDKVKNWMDYTKLLEMIK
jgi:DNA ligase (NAD+)